MNRANFALGLSILVNPDMPSLANGYKLLCALEWAGETPFLFIPDDELHYKAEFLTKLGFMEREAERGKGAWRYKITDCGLRFLGLRPVTMDEALPDWIRIHKADGGRIDINLANKAQHPLLTFYARQLG